MIEVQTVADSHHYKTIKAVLTANGYEEQSLKTGSFSQTGTFLINGRSRRHGLDHAAQLTLNAMLRKHDNVAFTWDKTLTIGFIPIVKFTQGDEYMVLQIQPLNRKR